MAHPETRAFGDGENAQDDGGDEHVYPEESADPVGKELMQEQGPIEAMLQDPRHELGIGQNQSENREQQIKAA